VNRLLLAGLLLASCAAPRARPFPGKEPGIQPASFVAPIARHDDSADAPHPKKRDGTLVHDWMLGGDGLWRCWFCNTVKRS